MLKVYNMGYANDYSTSNPTHTITENRFVSEYIHSIRIWDEGLDVCHSYFSRFFIENFSIIVRNSVADRNKVLSSLIPLPTR